MDLIRWFHEKQSDLSLHCLPGPFCHGSGAQILMTFTIYLTVGFHVVIQLCLYVHMNSIHNALQSYQN